MQKHFAKAKEYGDDKVQLAIQTYELVDKHIRRLDSDLARFESEIKNGPSASANTTATTTTTPGEPGPVVNNKRKLNSKCWSIFNLLLEDYRVGNVYNVHSF